MNRAETEYQKLLTEYEGAVAAYGAAVRALRQVEFDKCVLERAIAEAKIANLSHSMLDTEHADLRQAADAIGDRLDQLRVKIRDHKKANATAEKARAKSN